MWSDPIADMLTRIRNGTRAGKSEVKIPSSKVKVGIAQVLKDEGYISDFDQIDDGKQGVLRVTLRRGPQGQELIRSINRESRPGRRRYVEVDRIPRVLDGLGIAILSTSQGVLSDRACRERRIGGELLCTIY
jgi:small subunit ribosomal protein S8